MLLNCPDALLVSDSANLVNLIFFLAMPCMILVIQPGITPMRPALGVQHLNTGPPGKSATLYFFFSHLFLLVGG